MRNRDEDQGYRAAHREEIAARQLAWEERHRETRNAQKRRYYALHREEIAARRSRAISGKAGAVGIQLDDAVRDL